MTRRVFLLHWNADEATARVGSLRERGWIVEHESDSGASVPRAVDAFEPDVVLVDLSCLPSHGHSTAAALRTRRASREIPLVFTGGKREKVERVRADLPDDIYCEWDDIEAALDKAIEAGAPPPRPADERPHGYSGTPLPKKLGIKEGSRVALVAAPEGFDTLLDPLPDDVQVRRRAQGTNDVVVFFTKSRAEFETRLPRLIDTVDTSGGLWIAWPKRSSGLDTDMTEDAVREVALPTGLVDNKVCAIDATWSGLRLVRRRENR